MTNDNSGPLPEVDQVARDVTTKRLGLVLEVDPQRGRVRLRELTSGVPWWAELAVVRRLAPLEELSLRLAAQSARELSARIAAVKAKGLL